MSSNARKSSASKIKLDTYDDLFGNDTAENSSLEQIISVPLADLHTFKDHPFRVVDDEKMEETTESITNIKAYMITSLYNAPNTINHYYQQEVQHDMYGGGWHEKGIV